MDNKKRLKTRKKIIESVAYSQESEERKKLNREIYQRQVTGKQFCPDKYYGYLSENTVCENCPDSCDCLEATIKRLQTVSEQLYKLFDFDDACYNHDDWIDHTDIDVDEKRQQISDFVTSKMHEIEENPDLFHKVKLISKLTNKSLDAIVPGWKQFRQNKPKLHPYFAISRLEQITNETRDAILESASTTDIDTAWSDIVEEAFYDPIRKSIVTKLYNHLQEYCELLKEAFQKEFCKAKKDEKYWPAKWMQNDKEIRLMLNKCPHFESILNVMWRKRKHLDYQQSQNQIERLLVDEKDDEKKIVDSSKIARDRALLPESVTYESIAKEIGKSVSLVQKYVKAMNDIGVLKIYSQKGRNSFTVFSIGYWTEWNSKNRIVPYLQEKVYGKKGPKYQTLVNFKVDYNT